MDKKKASSQKVALIIGISGQDGALLTKFLLKKSYKVVGQSRSIDSFNNKNLKFLGLEKNVDIKFTSLFKIEDVESLINESNPDEIYNFSGQTSVGLSYRNPIETANSHVTSTLNILSAIRNINLNIKFFNAGSGEVFGNIDNSTADENTPFNPVSPYGASKASSTHFTSVYRESYNMFTCTGIFFNHESGMRSANFVTKKIAIAAHEIANGSHQKLYLGNIDIIRDWGWAEEYVEAAWKMLNRDAPDDFIIATGVSQSLRDLARNIFLHAGLKLDDHLVIDNNLFRNNEPASIKANTSKAKKLLPWSPKIYGEAIAKYIYIDSLKESKVQI